MARPCRARRICAEPAYDCFVPSGLPGGAVVTLTLDEYEALRLIDLEKCTQESCARQMDISRTTVAEIYASAREKLADCLVNGRTLVISGGRYRLCGGDPGCPGCTRRADTSTQTIITTEKGESTMRIAVTYENGSIFQHFGHTEQFKLYDVEDGKIVSEKVTDTNGTGHGALAGLLAEGGVDILICGGIGGGAQAALAQAGVKLYGGVSGSADDAVKAFIAGNLGYDPNVKCSHHGDGEHSCGGHGGADHACGSHGCGEHKCH